MCKNFDKLVLKKFIICLCVAFGLLIPQVVFAQDGFMELGSLDSVDFAKLKIPPLEVLYENAKKGPEVKIFQSQIEEQASLLKTEKRNWLKYFKVGGSWQYGKMGINSSFSDEYTPLFYSYSGAVQNSYYASASISISLDDVFDRKNRVKKQKLALETSQLQIDKWQEDQKILIIEAYSQVIKEYSSLKVKQEALMYANALLEESLNDFQNGNIKLADLNVNKTTQMNAKVSYENSRAELMGALLRLEILSKTKIISK